MRTSILLILLVISGCTQVFAKQYDDEKMYDLASRFKDLTQKVDGYIKFSDDQQKSKERLIERSGALNSVNSYFSDYELIVDVQGDHVVLMLCDDDIALIEDAGCNAKVDKTYWQRPTANSCQISLKASQVCL